MDFFPPLSCLTESVFFTKVEPEVNSQTLQVNVCFVTSTSLLQLTFYFPQCGDKLCKFDSEICLSVMLQHGIHSVVSESAVRLLVLNLLWKDGAKG